MNKIIKIVLLGLIVFSPAFCFARGVTFSSGTGSVTFASGTGSVSFIKLLDVSQSGAGDGLGGSEANAMSIAAVNALTSIYSGGETIYRLHGTITTGFNSSVAGTSGCPQILEGGIFSGVGNIFDQQYWRWQASVSNNSSGDAVGVTAANCAFYNLTIYNPTGNGIEHSQNVTIKNVLFESIGSGTGINTTGGILTASNNFIDSDGDPLFVNATGGDFHILAGSPCIDAGTTAGDAGLSGLQTDFYDVTRYFAPYDRLNIGIDQTYSDADLRPDSFGQLLKGIY